MWASMTVSTVARDEQQRIRHVRGLQFRCALRDDMGRPGRGALIYATGHRAHVRTLDFDGVIIFVAASWRGGAIDAL